MNRIALVRPERARGVEDLLARMAQGGQLRGRVSEDQLIGVLDQVGPIRFPVLREPESLTFSTAYHRSRRARRSRGAEEVLSRVAARSL